MIDNPWLSVLDEWRKQGRPADITPCELAFLRLIDARENGWREAEALLFDCELKRAATTLVAVLRAGNTRVYAQDGKLMIGGGDWRPYEAEIRVLREHMLALVLAER